MHCCVPLPPLYIFSRDSSPSVHGRFPLLCAHGISLGRCSIIYFVLDPFARASDCDFFLIFCSESVSICRDVYVILYTCKWFVGVELEMWLHILCKALGLILSTKENKTAKTNERTTIKSRISRNLVTGSKSKYNRNVLTIDIFPSVGIFYTYFNIFEDISLEKSAFKIIF